MKVFFNASVILAGIGNEQGGSGFLLKKVLIGEIEGVISELIFNEAVRHADRINHTSEDVAEKILKIFPNPTLQPSMQQVEKYLSIVVDEGDAHVLAGSKAEECDILVTLDKKHLLILKGKIDGLDIVTPGELLEKLR